MNKQVILISVFVIFIMTLFTILHYEDIGQEFSRNYGINFVKPKLENCDIFDERVVIKLLIYCIGDHLASNARIIPFIMTVATFPLVALLSYEISRSRLALMVSVSTLFMSRIFTFESTTITGDGTWSFFLILTIYLFYRKSIISPISFLVSVLMKGVGLLIVPVLLVWIRYCDRQISKKVLVIISVIFIFCIVSSFITSLIVQPLTGTIGSSGFRNDLLYVFRSDGLFFFYFIMTSIIGLAVFSYKKDRQSLLLLLFIGYFYSLVLILPMLSYYTMFDYRMIPMIVISSIGFGHVTVLVVDKIKKKQPRYILLLLIALIPTIVIGSVGEELSSFKPFDIPISQTVLDIDLTKPDITTVKLNEECNVIVNNMNLNKLLLTLECQSDSDESSLIDGKNKFELIRKSIQYK